MEYSLRFQAKKAPATPWADFKVYFQGRENYTLNEYQALYSNEDTGVYFTFQHKDERAASAGSVPDILPVTFTIGLFRSHVFILEAEPELTDFVKTFDLRVSDLRLASPDFGDYNQIDFYRGWSAASEAYYKSEMQKTPGAKLLAMPLNLLEKCWHWNYHLRHLQGELGREVFAPRVLIVDKGSELNTAVVWTDAVPIALPKVDLLLLYRKSGLRHPSMALADEADIEPLLSGFPLDEEFFPYYTLIYKEPPVNIRHFFHDRKPVAGDSVKFISYDHIHDLEMLMKVRRDLGLSA